MRSLDNHRPLTGSSESLAWAALGVELARQAVLDAERHTADIEETVRLCDEVIRRRIRLRVLQLRAGWTPSQSVLRQMARDRELLKQPLYRTP